MFKELDFVEPQNGVLLGMQQNSIISKLDLVHRFWKHRFGKKRFWKMAMDHGPWSIDNDGRGHKQVMDPSRKQSAPGHATKLD